MNIWQRLLRRAGWTFSINIDAEATPRCVVCVAPHTSNWDFVLGEVCIRSVGRTAGFLMKDTWFFFPLGLLLRKIGGVAVNRKTHTNITEQVARQLQDNPQIWIAVTPEGTRSRNPHWHKGCIHIAQEAGVPLVLAYIDYGQRHVCVDRVFPLTGDADADLVAIKQYYEGRHARFPEKFDTGLHCETPQNENS